MFDTRLKPLPEVHGLSQALGRVGSTAVVVGGIIGTSIFIIPSAVAAGAGTPFLSLCVWLTAGFLTLIAALCLAELSAALPATGGPYVFLRRGFRSELLAFGFGWTTAFVVGPGALAVVAVICSTFVAPYVQVGLHLTAEPTRLIALLLITLTTVTNLLGMRLGGLVQTILAVGKVIALGAIVAVVLAVLGPDVRALAPKLPVEATPALVSGLTSGLILCVFCFGGAHQITLVAAEVKQPQLSIPLAIIFGMAVVTIIYLAFNAAILCTLPLGAVTHSKRIAADVMSRALGAPGTAMTTGAVVLSGLGVLNAQCMAYPRALYALASDGLLHHRLATISARSRAPAVAIVVHSLCAGVYLLSGSYEAILGYMAFVSQLFMTLTVLAVFAMRRAEPALDRPYRAWGYPWLPALYVILSGIYLLSLVVTQTFNTVVGVLVVAAGLPVFVYFQRMRANTSANASAGAGASASEAPVQLAHEGLRCSRPAAQRRWS